MMYGSFAQIYDELMDDYDYDSWAEYYVQLIGLTEHDRAHCRLAECACGTGNLTVRLSEQFSEVIGIDASADMLRVAEEKARNAGTNVHYIKQDMRRLALGKKVDVLLCTCDGINYLTREVDVSAFFQAAFQALKAGGIFCFDISSAYKLRKILGNSFQGEERDGIAYLWKNRFNEERHTVHMDITFFVREDDGRYRRFREEHRQCAHEEHEIRNMLSECGFVEIEAFGEYRFDKPNDTDTRIHFRAKKPA